jgi:hypothetical protein
MFRGGFLAPVIGRFRAATSREQKDIMARAILQYENEIARFRQLLPAQCATAQAIDRRERWERIAQCAVDDGYLEFAEELGRFIEVCLRHGA